MRANDYCACIGARGCFCRPVDEHEVEIEDPVEKQSFWARRYAVWDQVKTLTEAVAEHTTHDIQTIEAVIRAWFNEHPLVPLHQRLGLDPEQLATWVLQQKHRLDRPFMYDWEREMLPALIDLVEEKVMLNDE